MSRMQSRFRQSSMQILDLAARKMWAGQSMVDVEEMVGRIKAAVASRLDPNFMIIARTDARAVEGFDRALERAGEYLAAGADGIFPEALQSADEFRDFA